MKWSIKFLLVGIPFFTLCSKAQPWFRFNDSISVSTMQGVPLPNAWAGGLNSPQFSEIHLNNDSLPDLFVFDRVGDRISTFINTGLSGEQRYRYDPFYSYFFPRLQSWVLLRDYDNDGKEDIFSYKPGGGGMWVFKNVTESDTPRFELIKNIVTTVYFEGGNQINLYISAIDIPAIVDTDGDGDLDVVTFNLLGGFIDEHRNQSMELYGHADSLIYKRHTQCWGKVYEEATGNTYVLDTCETSGGSELPPDQQPMYRHAGSTLVMFDSNGDGKKDLVLGDITFNTLALLMNDGTADSSHVYQQSQFFPQSPEYANLPVFPAAFYLDVDGDGRKDFIASPNAVWQAADYNNVWFYKNSGTTDNPQLSLSSKSFLNRGMIENGSGAYPALADMNGDGLLDIVVGNQGIKTDDYGKGRLLFFKNTGTSAQPAFTLADDNLAGLFNYNYNNPYPAIGDLDGDSDPDLLVGKLNGSFDYYKNNGLSNGVPQFVYEQGNYQNLSVGSNSFSSPQLFDVDFDGDLDLMVGEQAGNLNFFRNNGTASNPQFSFITDNFGGVSTRTDVANLGYSTPQFFRINGKTRLFLGSEEGSIFYYDSIDNNLEGLFKKVTFNYQAIDEGTRTAVALGWVDNDTLPDLIMGNLCGGLSYYKGSTQGGNLPSSITPKTPPTSFVSVYPNPATHELTITSPFEASVYLLNLQGKIWMQTAVTEGESLINIQAIPAGLYVIRVVHAKGASQYKIAIVH